MKERQEILDQEALAADSPRTASRARKFDGKSVVPAPGDTVIQRANIFTDVVGPPGATTTARFLYVEAYNKSTRRRGHHHGHRPDAGAVVRGRRRRLRHGDQHGPLHRHRPDAGRVHVPPSADPPAGRRQADIQTSASPRRRPPAAPRPASRPTRSPSGSARTSRRTSRASRTSRSSRTTRTRPRTARDLDALAAAYPDLVSVGQHAREDRGYQRKSQAIMAGTTGIGSAPPASRSARRCSTPRARSRPRRRSPRSRSPATAGQASARPSTASRPVRPTSSCASRIPPAPILQTVDTGTSPEIVNQTLPTTGTYTYEVSGYQGDLGDFTFKVQRSRLRRASAAAAVVLTSKDWGHEGGNQVQAEFREPGPDRTCR